MAIIKANFKAVAVDFDGTLLSSNHKIIPNNSKILRELHGLGIEIILASGRMKQSMVDIWKDLGIPCWVIAYNGAQILKTRGSDWENLYSVGVSQTTYREVLQLCKDRSIFLNIYTDKGIYAYQPQQDWQWADFYSHQTGAVYIKKLAHRSELPREGIIKLLAITPLKDRQPLIDEIQGEFTKHCQIIKSNPEYTEFHNPTVSKGNALKTWSEISGIPCEKVVALGDAENDFEMLSNAGLGIAAKNSTPGLKKLFDNFSEYTNDEDFVSRELTSLFLQNPE